MLHFGASLAVRPLRCCTSTVGGPGSIPGQETKIPHAAWLTKKVKRKCDILTPFTPFSHLHPPPSLATNLFPISCLFFLNFKF